MNPKKLVIILFLAIAPCFARAMTPQQISSPLGTLSVSADGIGLQLDGACPSSAPHLGSMWTLTLEEQSTLSRTTLFSKGQSLRTEPIADGFRIVYDSLTGDRTWNVVLELDFTAADDGFVVTGRITNREPGWYALAFDGPVIGGLQTTLDRHHLYLPTGLGQEFVQNPTAENPIANVAMKGALAWKHTPETNCYRLTSHYPSRFATMQWCALAGPDGGLYLASHDAACRSKHFNVEHDPAANTLAFHFTHEFVCFDGQTAELPPLVVRPYKGSWHRAADFYRNWYDGAMAMRKVPAWAQNASGWLLTILKQQNDEIMWDYKSVGGELADIAAARGLDIIGLFGWTEGGHDRWYPYYRPDKAMGGREELIAALQKLRAKGLRSVLYANGQLIDQHGTDYWESTGKQITVVQRDGKLDYQKWHKYYNAPARFHGMACLGTSEWGDRMLALAEQANELGADGILYDQLAVTAPKYCYAANHGHGVPTVVYEQDRYALLQRIADHMSHLNPDFMVMTEGQNDAELNSVGYFHGYENGAYVPLQNELDARLDGTAPTSVFPEMFCYTFPEVLFTFRNPSPVNNRLILNYSTAFGMHQELEARYAADRRYLEQDRTPRIEDYANVVSKPDLTLVTSQDPQAMLRYTRQVIDLQRRHQDLLWHGRYLDTQGFSLKAPRNVIAKAFTTADRMGIVVWNVSDKAPADFSIEVPGYKLTHADSPEGAVADASASLAPQSIRIFVYTKQ